MTKLETIRQKCIEANPEIVELKFGCEVLNKHLNQNLLVTHMSSNDECINCFYVGESNTTWIWKKYFNEETFEIIGRPIRLADVLLAIEKMGIPKNLTKLRPYNAYLLDLIGIHWNLKKDDLSLQSDETISFLYELLK